MSKIITRYKDDGNGGFSIKREQDVSDIIIGNKDLKETSNTKDSVMGYHVGEIPNIVIEQWIKEFGCTYHELLSDPELKQKMFQKLNSKEYSHFKIYNGKI